MYEQIYLTDGCIRLTLTHMDIDRTEYNNTETNLLYQNILKYVRKYGKTIFNLIFEILSTMLRRLSFENTSISICSYLQTVFV